MIILKIKIRLAPFFFILSMNKNKCLINYLKLKLRNSNKI